MWIVSLKNYGSLFPNCLLAIAVVQSDLKDRVNLAVNFLPVHVDSIPRDRDFEIGLGL